MTDNYAKDHQDRMIEEMASYDIWRQERACNVDQLHLIYSSQPHEQMSFILDSCYNCPVRIECLKFSIVTQDTHGIWGGLTEENRRKLSLELHKAFGRKIWSKESKDKLSEKLIEIISTRAFPFTTKRSKRSVKKARTLYEEIVLQEGTDAEDTQTE